MYLTRKRTIELCIELWEWLAKTGKRKVDWPNWNKWKDYYTPDNFSIGCANECWLCEYDAQRVLRHNNNLDFDKLCMYCPLKKQIGHCSTETHYKNWARAKTMRTRKKYAKLFLKQLKTLK